MIPHSKPWITARDHEAVHAALAGGVLAQGQITERLETELAAWIGGAGGVAVASGSAAVVLALRTLDLGVDDDVVLPTYVCASLLEAVRTVGAKPVLVDVGPDWIMTPELVGGRLTPRTRAVIIPHLYGIFADTAAFAQFGIPVIEDCAQAVGARGARPMAGDFAVFSLHPTKCFTGGEGGVVVARIEPQIERLRQLRDGGARCEHARLFSPLSNIAAALALAQLARYGDALDRRKYLADRYLDMLREVRPALVNERAMANSMFFRLPLRTEAGLAAFQDDFAARGIAVRRGVDRLLHRQTGDSDQAFPNAMALFRATVSLPIYPALSNAEHSQCVRAARELFARRG